MAEAAVNFTLGQGGLGRPLQGFDHYSAMVGYYYESAAITAYATIGDKTYGSITDAEADGIVNTCAEATAGSVTETVTNKGATGDIVSVDFTSYDGTVINLCTYTTVSGDSSTTLLATSLVAAINANTYIHGFTAVVGTSGAYTVTATKALGVWVNSKSIVYTVTGTVAITAGTFSGGTKSWLAIWHYQISEFFRGNPLGILYFSIKLDLSSQNITAFNTQLKADVASVAEAFNGQARRIGLLANGRTFATSMLDAMKVAQTALFAAYTPATISITANNTATALSAQPNLRALLDEACSFVAGQSGSGVGYELSKTQMQVISSLGLALGCSSKAAVSQSFAEVGAFNVSDGTECETPVFLDGTTYASLSQSVRNQLNDFGYIYLRKFPTYTGTYFNADSCAVSPASDYADIRDNLTIFKAVRGVYVSILPLLNARNSLNSDGTLDETSIASYVSLAGYPLTQMFKDGDLSLDPVEVSNGIVVSRAENVATTKKIPITIKLVPRGIGREINITIGYGLTS